MVLWLIVGGLAEIVKDTRLGAGARITFDNLSPSEIGSFLKVNRVVEHVITHSELLIVVKRGFMIAIISSVQIATRQPYFSGDA